MMKAVLLHLALISALAVLIDGANIQKLATKMVNCICDERTCHDDELVCPPGVPKIRDQCNCCLTCARLLGEECGGWLVHGVCAPRLGCNRGRRGRYTHISRGFCSRIRCPRLELPENGLSIDCSH